ncbi:MAG: DUF6273 domain-containing protein [Lachnospiraceae bacterium]
MSKKDDKIIEFALFKKSDYQKREKSKSEPDDKEEESFGEVEDNKSESESVQKQSLAERIGVTLVVIVLMIGIVALFAVAIKTRMGTNNQGENNPGTGIASGADGDSGSNSNANSPYAWWYERDVAEGVSVATDADALPDSGDSLIKGERILFGTYNQGPSGEVDKIAWIVLEAGEDYAMLTTEYVLDTIQFSKSGNVQWEDSDVRTWLEDGFYNQAFSNKEKERILSLTVENNDNPLYNTEGGANTVDKVYLLSLEDMEKYFGNLETVCRATPFAKEKGAAIGSRGNTSYWLRSPGSTDKTGIDPGNAAMVDSDGIVRYEGTIVTYTVIGIRPVIRIKI